MEFSIEAKKNQQAPANKEQNEQKNGNTEEQSVSGNEQKATRQRRRAKQRQEERVKEQEQKISAKFDQLLQRARSEWRKEGIPSQEMKEREESVRAGIHKVLESGYGCLSGNENWIL